MKINLPVTQTEKPYPRGQYLVSKTDLKGAITYANDAFVALSGFTRDELIGKNHNLVRHPDMPPQAFENLWRTVQKGLPWRGIVKNRAKNGDHYWVDAFVVPIRKNDQTIGYMSVRSEPGRDQVRQAEELYRRLNETKSVLPSGGGWLKSLSIRARLVAVVGVLAVLIAGGAAVGISGQWRSNQALGYVYQDKLEPSTRLGRVMLLLGDNRSQIMLGLQHNPTNPLAHLHDHPLSLHIEATLKNRDEINRLLDEIQQHPMTPEEKLLAGKFKETRERFSKEGVNPAREALKAGEYNQANEILLASINPLFKQVAADGDVLLKEMLDTAKEEYEREQARFRLMLTLSIGGTLGALVLAVVGGWLLVRAIVRPMNKAIHHFDHIAQGNLTEDIDISGRDEAGRLMCNLAAMQVHLKVMLDEVTVAAQAIQDGCDQLDGEMTRVVAQSEEQHDRVQSVAAATEEFSQSVHEVAESAKQAAQAAVGSQGLVQESNQSMSHSMEATGRVVEAVQASSVTITALNQSIQQIGEVTNAIKEIADQTNLLALNAAIEAARAGELGRGFAVVADEVRKLAERTTTSTADIAAMVGEIQNTTRQAVSTMDRAVTEVEEGIGMMRQSVAGLDKITRASNDVTDMSQHIAAAAQQQAASSEEVAGNMEQVSLLIDQNTASAQQAKREADELLETARQLKAMIGYFELHKK